MSKANKLFPYRDNQGLDKDIAQLYEWVSRLEYTETNPDGARTSRYVGETVLLKSGGSYYVEVATGSNSTVWRGVLLSDTP